MMGRRRRKGARERRGREGMREREGDREGPRLEGEGGREKTS